MCNRPVLFGAGITWEGVPRSVRARQAGRVRECEFFIDNYWSESILPS